MFKMLNPKRFYHAVGKRKFLEFILLAAFILFFYGPMLNMLMLAFADEYSVPAVLLLDEPFSALDAKIRQQMREELKKIQSDLGITVVFVTHDQEEAMALSHRIVVMNKGKFEQVGTPTEIYDKPQTRHVAGFIGEMNFIEHEGKTIAVRPEDVTVTQSAEGEFTGEVRTIMVLGHYVVVTVQHGNEVVKCFVDREVSERLHTGETVGLKIGKHSVF